MKITRHLPFKTLADMAENRLSADERASLLGHVSACSHCSGQLDKLTQLVQLMRTDTAEDAPRDVKANAVALFHSRAASAKPSVVRRVLAALNFDSAQSMPAYGLRSGQSQARQFLYSAGENDVDLRVKPSGESWIVSGQVLGQCTGGQVSLKGDAGMTSASMNDLCEFTLPPVPSGRYTLQLRLTDVEVEVPDLDLKA
ncbi:MAG TPA: hypothetical protein VF658_04290 [Pyrinomonadaceae bacterium]|jgi:hypothetical protein